MAEEAVCCGAFLSRINIARGKSSPCLQLQHPARYRCRQLQGSRSPLAQGESEADQLVGRLMLDRAVSGMADDRYSSCCSLDAWRLQHSGVRVTPQKRNRVL